MHKPIVSCLLLVLLSGEMHAAQPEVPAPIQTAGTLVIVPAYGEVKQANDEARFTLMAEEQDKDKAAAASRVNQKMRQGAEIVRREDPQAVLKTRGYYTYPVYADEQGMPRAAARSRQPAAWRVGQYLDVTTGNLARLPQTVAAAQAVLALNGLAFGLSDAVARRLEEQRIAAAYTALTERIAAIAKAMGRRLTDAVLDAVDFEASGAYAQQPDLAMPKVMRAAASEAAVEAPNFEPGDTTLGMRVVGKIRFR